LGCIQCTTLCFRSCVLFFRNEHDQSTSLGPKLSFWVVLRDSVAGRYPLLDRVLGCIQCTTLCFRSCVLFFRNKHAQSTSLGPKLSFWVVLRDSIAGRYPLLDRVLGCIQCTTLSFRSCVLFFRNKHAQSTSLGPKLCFWVVSCDSVAGRYKLCDRVLGCIKCTTLCFRSCFLFLRNELAQS